MKSNNLTGRFKTWLHKPQSLAGEIFTFFLIFSFVLVVILWLFQIVFLDNIYQSIKISAVKSTANKIVEEVNSESLSSLVDSISLENDMTALIVDFSDGTKLSGNPIANNNFLGFLTLDDLQYLYQQTTEKGSLMFYLPQMDSYDNVLNDSNTSPHGGDTKSVIYVTSTVTSENHAVMVIIGSLIRPVNATTSTLRILLVYISITLILISIILSIFASKHISKPIEQINKGAKIMATGDYSVAFTGKGYKEIEELNDTLNYTVSQLKKADQMSKDLIANVSHDLRTPLTMISGYGEVMRDLPNENTPENVQVIIDEANRLTSLVNNLLDISKLQAGTIGLSINQVNVTDLLMTIGERYKKMISKDGYDLVCDIPANDVYVDADAMRLQQVFYNLLNNAITYTGPDKKITMKMTVESRHVRFDVIDTGKGIAKEDIPLIWQRYYKVDKEHVRPETGSGLGLSIVKTILELHKAQYGVESELGSGSDFWFILPLAEGND